MIRTSMNYVFCIDDSSLYELVSDEPSMTVPNMAYTVRDIYERFTTRNLPLINQKQTYTEDEFEDPDFEDYLGVSPFTPDITDIEIVREAHLHKLKSSLKEAKTKRDSQSSQTSVSDSTGSDSVEPSPTE